MTGQQPQFSCAISAWPASPRRQLEVAVLPVDVAAQAVGHERIREAGRSILRVRYALATRQRMRVRLRADRPRPVDGLPAERQLHSERSEKRLPPPLEHAPGPIQGGVGIAARIPRRDGENVALEAGHRLNKRFLRRIHGRFADPPAIEIPAAFVDDLFHKPGNRRPTPRSAAVDTFDPARSASTRTSPNAYRYGRQNRHHRLTHVLDPRPPHSRQRQCSCLRGGARHAPGSYCFRYVDVNAARPRLRR